MIKHENEKERLRHQLKELQRRVNSLETLIDKRKQTEVVQLDMLKEYFGILQELPDIVYKIDPDGHFTYVNKSVKILGYEPEELIGKHFSTIVHPDDTKSFSRAYVLPQFKGMMTGYKNSPKLFDERRTGIRQTKNLTIRMVSKNKKDEVVGTLVFVGEVSAAGHYGTDMSKEQKRFLGTLGIIRDITDRKQMEEVIRESEKKYKTLTDNLNGGVYRNTADEKGRFIEANPAIITMFGYDSREEFLKIAVANLYLNPEGRKSFSEKIKKYGFVKNEELQLKKKDGTPFFGSVSAVAIRDENGDVLYYDGIVEDITDRRRMEEALREQQERAQRYLDMAGVMLVVIGADQRVGSINQKGCELLGCSEQEIVGKNWFDNFVPEEQRDAIRRLFEKLIHREKKPDSHYENFVLTRDGKKRMVLWHTTLLVDDAGTVTGTLSSGEDITERIEAEKALRESEEKFRLLFENAKDAILWADAMTGVIINCNKSAEVLFETKKEELIGMHQASVHPPDKAEYYTSMFQKHIDQNGFADDEAEIITRSGKIRQVTITASVTIVEGRPIIQGIFHDITERKRAEDELKVMATTDALTNVPNRGTGLLLFGKQLQMAKRNNMKLSVCYIDFNDLKGINDTYGHQEGDEALKRVANYLKEVLRAIDIVCRLGGDEFLIVLPQCPLENARSVWQRIANHIQQFNESGIKPYKISLSHGFAEFDPADEKTVDQLIAVADQEMYKDKQTVESKKPQK